MLRKLKKWLDSAGRKRRLHQARQARIWIQTYAYDMERRRYLLRQQQDPVKKSAMREDFRHKIDLKVEKIKSDFMHHRAELWEAIREAKARRAGILLLTLNEHELLKTQTKIGL